MAIDLSSNDGTNKAQDSDQRTLRSSSPGPSRESRTTGGYDANMVSRMDTANSRASDQAGGRSSYSSGLRYRNSTRRRPQQQQQQQQSYASGRAQDANNYNLSLAGQQDPEGKARAQNQHQPYVEPGYADLNPAYEQPANVRPIWGLAEPLPRIVRRGMKPSPHDIESDKPRSGEEDNNVLQPTDSELEKGIGPELNMSKLSKNLKDVTEERERAYVQKFGKKLEPPSEMGQESQTQPSGPFKPLPTQPEAPEEEEGARLGIPRPPIESLNPEQNSDHEESDSEPADDESEDAHRQDEEEHMPLNNVMEEIHNHHTRWSVIRTKLREPLAETLAVIVLVGIGVCANLAYTIAGSGSGDSMAWAWGIATMMGIYIAGGVSGGHLNPAITIMLYIFRGFPRRKILVYIIAQVLGAYIGGLIAYGIYRNYILQYLDSHPQGITDVFNSFVTDRKNGVTDVAAGYLTEFVATAFLGIIILALGDDSNAPPGAGMNAFILGLVISVETMAFSANTGAALNPARDMGPRLALITVGFSRHALFSEGWWVYGAWCATITGALVGAAFYDVAIFVGGESPVNYPKKSIVRAGQKAKARWRHRIRRGG